MRWCRWLVVVVAVAACYQDVHLDASGNGGGDGGGGGGAVDALPPGLLLRVDAQLPTEIDDVPVLVLLPGDLASPFGFTNTSTGATLPYELVGPTSTGQIEVWFRLDKLPSGGQDVVMGHDGMGATMQADPAAVWHDYELVAHLGTADDSTTKHGNGVIIDNATFGVGHIGNAVALDGQTGTSLELSDVTDLFDGWSELTLELWLEPEYVGAITGQAPQVADPNNALGELAFVPGGGAGASIDVTVSLACANSTGAGITVPIANEQWTSLAASMDSSGVALYRNGEYLTTNTNPQGNPLVAGTGEQLTFGSLDNLAMSGGIDEVRVSNQAHGSDYERVEYLAGAGLLVTFPSD